MQRLVRVHDGAAARWGLVDGERVVALASDPFRGLEVPGEDLGALDECELLAPVAPTKVVCVGRNYAAHAAEHGADVPAEPLIFLKPPSSVIGPGAAIMLPPQSQQVEHEGELALVIGQRCRRVAAEEAWSMVGGLTCANDVTARDLQRLDGQWTRGKGFDTFCPLGPWVVTGVGEAEAADLEVTCAVNGERRQHGCAAQMVFPPAQLIAWITSFMTLEVGDVVLTGTPAGVGRLMDGDTVEVAISTIGRLENPVRAELGG
jgi:2-keto-4-pentenoate hydratase/2-oxohepta-3-ene-1,7-dioic acid hydratase in catechol pathway